MRSRRPMRAWAALLSVPLLVACQGGLPEIPASAFECMPRPAFPEVLNSDADLGELIVTLDERGEDCAARLASIGRIVRR